MKGSFDFESICSIEFGVCYEKGKVSTHFYVPSGKPVQEALESMLDRTKDLLMNQGDGSEEYEPSQKYSNQENLFVELSDPLVHHLNELFQSENLPSNSNSLKSPQYIPYYFGASGFCVGGADGIRVS